MAGLWLLSSRISHLNEQIFTSILACLGWQNPEYCGPSCTIWHLPLLLSVRISATAWQCCLLFYFSDSRDTFSYQMPLMPDNFIPKGANRGRILHNHGLPRLSCFFRLIQGLGSCRKWNIRSFHRLRRRLAFDYFHLWRLWIAWPLRFEGKTGQFLKIAGLGFQYWSPLHRSLDTRYSQLKSPKWAIWHRWPWYSFWWWSWIPQ